MNRREMLATTLLLHPALQGRGEPRQVEKMSLVPVPALNPKTALRSLEIGAACPPEATFDHVDHDRIMHTAKKAGFQCVMIYSMEHWGYALYDTEIGFKHPNLHYDLVKEQVLAARRYGLSPLCYYSYNFAQAVAEHYPDWRMLDENGHAPLFRGRFYYVCQNSPYGQFMLDSFEELFSKYEFDGLFLDIIAAKPSLYSSGHDQLPWCFCPYCRTLWRQEMGTEFESGLDLTAGRRQRLDWERQKSGDKFVRKMKAAIRKYRPAATIGSNGGCLFLWKSVIDEFDYNYGEPEFTASGICLGGALMRGWGTPDYQEGIWMRDQRTIADQVPAAVQKAEGAAELVQGARLFGIGSLILGDFPLGFDEHTIETVGKACQGSDECANAIQGSSPIRSIAIISSEATFTQAIAEGQPTQMRKSVFGALNLFTGMNYPVNAVPDWQLEGDALHGHDLVVLPEATALSDSQIECIRAFVRDGGHLIASGRCTIFNERGKERNDFGLADVLGLNYRGQDLTYVGNLSRPGVMYAGATVFFQSVSHPLSAGVSGEPVGTAGPLVRVSGQAAEVFRMLAPLFKENIPEKTFYHWFPPPAGQPIGKGITCNTFGKGKAIYVAADIFSQYQDTPWAWMRQWTESLLRQLAPQPAIRLLGGQTAILFHGTFWQNSAARRANVLIANTSARLFAGTEVPIRDVKIASGGKLPVTEASIVYPAHTKLPLIRNGSAWEVSLPELGTLTVVELTLAQEERQQ